MRHPWPMPASAHVPGQTVRPENSPAFDAAAAAPPVTDADRWRDNAAYLYGIALYDGGFFWEAHEVWEPVWMGARPNSRERALLQGLIQLANACLKCAMARPRAAERLAGMAAGHLDEAGPSLIMGINAAKLGAACEDFATTVLTIESERTATAPATRPRISLEHEI